MKALGKFWIFISFFCAVSTFANSLESVVVAPSEIKTPEFREGETLGGGVVAKAFVFGEARRPTIHANKRSFPKRVVTGPAIQARSIASFSEDSKFSNVVIEKVRSKDSKDYEESMALVRAAIERGEYGKAAKDRLQRQK